MNTRHEPIRHYIRVLRFVRAAPILLWVTMQIGVILSVISFASINGIDSFYTYLFISIVSVAVFISTAVLYFVYRRTTSELKKFECILSTMESVEKVMAKIDLKV